MDCATLARAGMRARSAFDLVRRHGADHVAVRRRAGGVTHGVAARDRFERDGAAPGEHRAAARRYPRAGRRGKSA